MDKKTATDKTKKAVQEIAGDELPLEYESIEEWRAEARELFGDDGMKWRFVCPSCGYVASIQDWKDAGASSGEAAFSCIGRHLDKCHDAFQKGQGPCNYAGGGLFRINPIKIKGMDIGPFQFSVGGAR
uniref:Uncharacterized protein n=1 Tax=viral metagenome TaxID=1070528 RepID=A0A6M3LP67_9ZZZZ